MSPLKRREMICHLAVEPSGSMRGRKDKTKLSLSRQCKLLKISRLLIYYTQVVRIQGRLSWCMRLIGCSPNTRYSEAARLRLTPFSRAFQPGDAVFNARWTSWGCRPPTRDRTLLRSTQSTAFSIPAEEACNHAAQSCLVPRHLLHHRQERLPVSGGFKGFIFSVACMECLLIIKIWIILKPDYKLLK